MGLSHCPHSSGGCWFPYNGSVGICGLSLERRRLYAISQMLTKATIDSVRNERLTGQTPLISSCDNVKHDLESLLEQIDFSSFLSLARIITFSPPRTHSKPPSLEALYSFPPTTLYNKFYVSCFVFSHFNILRPASLSLLLHFNCDFHGYLTRSRSTCIKCPSGINLLVREH